MSTTSADPAHAQPASTRPLASFGLPPIVLYAVGLALLVAGPFFVYPLFLAKILCFCLFACAFNLLGSVGLLSFGHAAFFGASAYVGGSAQGLGLARRARRVVGTRPATCWASCLGYVAIAARASTSP